MVLATCAIVRFYLSIYLYIYNVTFLLIYIYIVYSGALWQICSTRVELILKYYLTITAKNGTLLHYASPVTYSQKQKVTIMEHYSISGTVVLVHCNDTTYSTTKLRYLTQYPTVLY